MAPLTMLPGSNTTRNTVRTIVFLIKLLSCEKGGIFVKKVLTLLILRLVLIFFDILDIADINNIIDMVNIVSINAGVLCH